MEPGRSGPPEEWPRTLVVQKRAWALEYICFRRTWQGTLAVGIPGGTTDDDLNAIRTLLLVCCMRLEHRLELESLDRRGVELEKELADLNHLADRGELTGPVVHELRNYLNDLLLHLALLEQGVPEDARPELDEIRRQGTEVAAMLNNLQESSGNRHSDLDKVDLNCVVSETAEDLQTKAAGGGRDSPTRSPGQGGAGDQGIRITLDLCSDRLAVMAQSADLKRLCSFLVRNAIAAAELNDGYVTIRTERASDRAVLCVADTGPAVSADPAQIFEPHPPGRAGRNTLELAACRSLVRRRRGAIRAELGSEQGLSITVQLPLSPE